MEDSTVGSPYIPWTRDRINDLIEWLGTDEAKQSFKQASVENEELEKIIDGMTQIPQEILDSYYSKNYNHLEKR